MNYPKLPRGAAFRQHSAVDRLSWRSGRIEAVGQRRRGFLLAKAGATPWDRGARLRAE